MAISNDDLFKLVKILPEEAKQSAYDFLKFLINGSRRPDWIEIEKMESENIPLSKEEERQMRNTDFLSWEDAMHELDLPTDIKP
ncbi:XRE family transcriptional regulator [Desulfitobacterium hafniense]|uniref:XRE family transcriptional regulator n=1 Tax=Desulfitobacterium hafniense TaxID=49338 RepID=A0A0W1JIL7_DESHA|nr:hypothetical protein [Desulfitobacterium hafniense]KTE91435.1 XRE family transcriptional regulator [Desulfitobacterium hafniense]